MIALLHAFIVLVVAGLAHIGSVFLIPEIAKQDIFFRLAQEAPDGSVTLIAPERIRQFPFADPFTAIAVCRYDLVSGPLRVRTRLSQTFLTVIFAEDRRGIFSSVSDRAATGGALDVVLALQPQLDRIAALDDKSEAVEEIRVAATSARGIAIIKVIVDRPSGREAAEAVLKDAMCQQEVLPGG